MKYYLLGKGRQLLGVERTRHGTPFLSAKSQLLWQTNDPKIAEFVRKFGEREAIGPSDLYPGHGFDPDVLSIWELDTESDHMVRVKVHGFTIPNRVPWDQLVASFPRDQNVRLLQSIASYLPVESRHKFFAVMTPQMLEVLLKEMTITLEQEDAENVAPAVAIRA